MAVPIVGKAMRKVFGTRNERMVKRYLQVVDQVSALESHMRPLTDAQLRAKTDELRERVRGGTTPGDILPEAFAVAREAMDRNVGIRNIFDPALGFDPATLPDDAQALYAQVKAEIDRTDAAPPEGDFRGCTEPTPSWMFVDIPIRLYEAVRELYPESKPPFRARPFDVQIVGAVVLYEGKIAEMKTGEGKTIVAPLATYLAALQEKQVHVVTVNDYLVQRDRDWTFPFFRAVGLTVGAIHPMHMQPPPMKQLAYDCDVVYGTTAEFGFDYLRDNMKRSLQEQVQKKREFAIVDEVDSTLIDEARTPLIISGLAHQNKPRYDLADMLARHLIERQVDWDRADQKVQSCLVELSGLEGDIRNAADKAKIPAMREQMEAAKARLPELEAERDRYTQFYEIELDKMKAQVTHEGTEEAQRKAGIGSFYVGDNIDVPHLLEQAIRAHTVYMRDRDYVVAPDDTGEMGVVIVDKNTGRKMVGRQWSDGLHQAVEAKEGVAIKEETQTMATITIQNFFKLYDRLSGMTGTADTEATEFHEIYRLDVIVIPTNVPVRRDDQNDVVFMSEKDKWEAIVDEIKTFHDVGRPVLVGTTSVESSETLSTMLTRKYNIKHEVLNAKQHEREADIIARAGELGAVMIATNMAGRGTDIKLRAFTPEQLIDHWKRRGLAPRELNATMPEDELVRAVYRHAAPKELELNKREVDALSDDDIRRQLLERWVGRFSMRVDEAKARKMSEPELIDELDHSGSCLLHRLRLYNGAEDVGGLHVVGTERHESRRVDNQLRGRSGRQGDNGSSRFFLSMEDELMKRFANKTMLSVLSRLGMKEGVSLESPLLTKSVERAQRKVEEHNFLIRKNILEYDEPMDVQRGIFYGQRQRVLEGEGVEDMIFGYIEDAVSDAVHTYLSEGHVAECVAEWARENMNVSVDADRVKGKDRSDLYRIVRVNAKEEASSMIRITIGEYMAADVDRTEWDLKSLADWANSNFKADLKMSEIQDMLPADAQQRIERAADKMIESIDLEPLDQFLVPNYGAAELVKWCKNKFGADFEAAEFAKIEILEDAVTRVMASAKAAYRKREKVYPVDFAIEMTAASFQQDAQQALSQFCDWVKARYELAWRPDALPATDPQQLRSILVEQAEKWDESRISERADRALVQGSSPEQLNTWFEQNMRSQLSEDEKLQAEDDPKTVAENKIAQIMRSELTQFERWILLQIFDQAWKDHLYQMDQIRESISLRSFSQRDPRIEFKKEASRAFDEMNESIRDRVSDLVFKAKLTPQVAPAQRPGPAGSPAPQPARAVPQPAQPAIAAAAAAASAAGTASQRADLEAAQQAGSNEPASRPRREPVRRSAPAVGRNEPCPCGSGKKFKQCCGRKS